MRKIRYNTKETNSSSTHTLTVNFLKEKDYLPKSDELIVKFIDMDEVECLTTLQDKVSYLVSQIINRYKYDYEDYEELKKRDESTIDFYRIKHYVEDNFNKTVVLPDHYKVKRIKDEDGNIYSDLEEIVNINHQVVASDLDDLLRDLVEESQDYLSIVLDENKMIVFGRD